MHIKSEVHLEPRQASIMELFPKKLTTLRNQLFSQKAPRSIPGFIFMYPWLNVSMKADIPGEKTDFAYPGTDLPFSKCICPQDVAGGIRDAAFKVLMGYFYRELKLPAFYYRMLF